MDSSPAVSMPMSGKEMIKLFEAQGWVVIRQRGSHITVGKNGERDCIPNPRELSKGTEHKLLKRLEIKK